MKSQFWSWPLIFLGITLGFSNLSCKSKQDEGGRTDKGLGPRRASEQTYSRDHLLRRVRSANQNDIDDELRRFRSSQSLESMAALQARIRDIPPDRLEELARDYVEDAANDAGSQVVVFESLKILAVTDPEKALIFFNSEAGQRIARYGFSGVALAVSQDNPSTLQNWLEKLDLKKESDRQLFSFGFDSLAQAHPLLSLQMLQSSQSFSDDRSLMTAFVSYGSQDPSEAMRLANQTYKGSQLEVAISGIAQGVYRTDPEMAMELLSRLDNTSTRHSQSQRMLTQWLMRDPAEASKFILTLQPEEISHVVDSSTFSTILDGNSQQAVAMLNKMVLSKENEWMYKLAVSEMILSAPDEALKIINSIPEGNGRNQMVTSASSRLAADDPDAAIRFIFSHAAPERRAQDFAAIGAEVERGNLDAALGYSDLIPLDARSGFVIAAFDTAASGDDLTGTIKLLNETSAMDRIPKQARDALYEKAMTSLAERNLDDAKRAVEDIPTDSRAASMRGLAKAMAKVDIAGLGEWLAHQPKDEGWREAGRVLVDEIRDFDPDLANQWEKSLAE